MKKKTMSFQGDLFDTSPVDELRRQVQELDQAIAKCLKKNDYQTAKQLTAQQESFIQELVSLGEKSKPEELTSQS